jgi:hypothetical protein
MHRISDDSADLDESIRNNLLHGRHGLPQAEVVSSDWWISPHVRRILLKLFLPHSVSPKQ